MNEVTIKDKINDALPCSEINVAGDGYHFTVEVISSEFVDLPRVKRQQMIYRLFADEIKSGELHALSIKALAPEEKQQLNT